MGKKGTRRCVFCGAGSLTREHAIPRWTVKELGPELDDDGARGIEELDPEDWPHAIRDSVVANERGELIPTIVALAPRRKAVQANDVKVKAVCAACNNGWMADLESAVRPLIRQLQTDEPVTLTGAQVHTLVRWGQKTSLMLDRWAPEPRTFPPEVFDALYRKDEVLPGHWHMRLARADEACRSRFSHSPLVPSTITLEQTTGNFVPGEVPQISNRSVGVQSHVVVGRLALMVRYIQYDLGPGVSIDGDFNGLGSRSAVVLGEGATRKLTPRKWPTYDRDAFENWDLWTPHPGAGVVCLSDQKDGTTTVALLTPPQPPALAKSRLNPLRLFEPSSPQFDALVPPVFRPPDTQEREGESAD